VQRLGLEAVGFGDVVERGRVLDAENVIEGGGRVRFVRGDLIADAEDFAI
jgi:hypothetical protein